MVGALPQRPRAGGRQLARRGDGRRAPGRVHDQRPGRARGQRLARGDRDGGAHAPGHLPVRHRHRRHADRAGVASSCPASPAIPVQPNKAIVGANAFAHESGIHQDGVLKHRETYEIMQRRATWAGAPTASRSASSPGATRSRRACRSSASTLASEEALNAAFARFKELADKKREIFDEDIQALHHRRDPDAARPSTTSWSR